MPRTSKVEYGREWWRKRYERSLWHKWALQCLVESRRGLFVTFWGSERWPIIVKGNRLYKARAFNRAMFPSEPVGRFHGKYLVIHKKLAPRWLKKWALTQECVYVLGDLDRETLAAHLVQEKLRGAQ